jgi:hypothetical protein
MGRVPETVIRCGRPERDTAGRAAHLSLTDPADAAGIARGGFSTAVRGPSPVTGGGDSEYVRSSFPPHRRRPESRWNGEFGIRIPAPRPRGHRTGGGPRRRLRIRVPSERPSGGTGLARPADRNSVRAGRPGGYGVPATGTRPRRCPLPCASPSPAGGWEAAETASAHRSSCRGRRPARVPHRRTRSSPRPPARLSGKTRTPVFTDETPSRSQDARKSSETRSQP